MPREKCSTPHGLPVKGLRRAYVRLIEPRQPIPSEEATIRGPRFIDAREWRFLGQGVGLNWSQFVGTLRMMTLHLLFSVLLSGSVALRKQYAGTSFSQGAWHWPRSAGFDL